MKGSGQKPTRLVRTELESPVYWHHAFSTRSKVNDHLASTKLSDLFGGGEG
ncbi:hypothetical protein MD535_10070 [Vibrio sp. ZSDZ65]|uniref:Uncharacterized protein n=1 Tax=Vibrio qingdaonensis TaxID=2829491 RepID=A0A9X3CMY8_9VIBR|nr:hypothetical protein [Vibrio qingdaonensis]MCW8346346.1 hypothetical protein [Vibrio qingdaonensis]